MKRPSRHPNTSLAVVTAVLVLLVAGPATSTADQQSASDPQAAEATQPDRQTRPRYAVAYSGYRAGQHPDRGDGANNPTEEQILEDLQILTHDFNFGLIRLYDSRENSEVVLRLIREHQLPLRVMLGIWLDAEISNHRSCPWLDEPIPDEVLAQNKKMMYVFHKSRFPVKTKLEDGSYYLEINFKEKKD